MKLWEKTSPHFRLRVTYGESARAFKQAGEMPVLYWPSGKVCWEINAYLISLSLLKRKSATLCTYAAELSHVLKFLDFAKHSLREIDDELLIEFANWLLDNGSKGAQVNRIINSLFHFLFWYQKRCFPPASLIGYDGSDSQIKVTHRRQSRHNSAFGGGGYHHVAFAEKSVPRTVTPMPMAHIQKIQGVVGKSAHRSFVRARNRTLILTLIESGIRRVELVSIRVSDLEQAITVGGPLKVVNAKKPEGNVIYRMVPVDLETLNTISDFAKRQRALMMVKNKQKNPNFIDRGFLFCKENGESLSASTVTRLFSRLRIAANISGRAHPHMLRHRWITMQLVALLKEVQSLGSPLAPNLIITALTRLASRSGHSTIDSLWTYVDFASEEMLAASAASDKQAVLKSSLKLIAALVDRLSNSNSAENKELGPVIKELRKVLAEAMVESSHPRAGLMKSP